MDLPASSAPVAHDVAIVGGGLVGASLAIALDRIGLNVALVEATALGDPPPVFDERNLSLADTSINALTTLGVLSGLRAPPGLIRRIHVSRAGDFGRVALHAADYGRDAFGLVVTARDLGLALEARLGACTRLVRYRPARFVGFETVPACRRALRLADATGERMIDAALVVGADGTRSAVRAALGIGVQEHDYQQTLFVTRVRASRPPDGTAWERFGPTGPNALLPRGDRHYGAVLGVGADQADAVAALDEQAFLQRLQHTFGWRAGRFLACGARSAYPAVRVLAEHTIAPGAVLVGNAAQTVHPIGAQGFNLGLRDAMTLAQMLTHAGLAAVENDGGTSLLARYVEQRREDRATTLAFCDGLARLTANPAPIAAGLRALGLLAADRVPVLQARIVSGAMGYRGQVPALCRVQDSI